MHHVAIAVGELDHTLDVVKAILALAIALLVLLALTIDRVGFR